MSIDFTILEEEVKNHIKDQPYNLKCSVCDTDLSVDTADTDDDLDLYITINPCQSCIDSAVETAKEEMENE